ncbi:MAG: aminotransferase class I/II-fold pyridoxal phosphate-dependent enzyme, partial [Desulfobacteraceae bacterium]|nr:aminotransferase class I/II-fold pyridoxal phosphate-dependent enzyme [Desulfobacteraceae bacterium]
TGIEREGIPAAYRAHGIGRCVVLASRLVHYSLRKAAGILGIGNDNVIPIDIDSACRMDMEAFENTIEKIKSESPETCILAAVGIAGATETGTVDPLDQMADICRRHKIHFHVDAAWGGPTLLSKKYKHLLAGIEKSDSVTIDGHKQFYMPMSCGMVYFRDPHILNVIAYYANYVNRRGSVDLGIKALSGSREANSLILDCALKIMGSHGYALLIDHGIETAAGFAEEIRRRPDFEIITDPVLNILTYRYCPKKTRDALARAGKEKKCRISRQLNRANRDLQRLQREAGYSFVSRTTLQNSPGCEEDTVVLRAVIMNPMTDMKVLREILDEQENIAKQVWTSVEE